MIVVETIRTLNTAGYVMIFPAKRFLNYVIQI